MKIEIELRMDYLTFRERMIEGIVFNVNQAKTVFPSLNAMNIYRWVEKGYLVKLRNGYYAFSECLKREDYNFFLSEYMYRPSYVSLQSAMAFYNLIPEAVVSTTAVTTLPTKNFKNKIGYFSYRTVAPHLFWGYKKYIMEDGYPSYYLATLEKAILDFLYLHPFYKTEAELMELRFDDYIMSDVLDRSLLLTYTERFGVSALKERVELLLSLYQ